MRKEQRTVAIGATSGLICLVVALLFLPDYLPRLSPEAATGDRLGFAAKWIALAAAPLLLAIIAIGNERALTEAIDPTVGKESRRMLINGRVVDNTLQQFALFVAAMLAVAAASRGDQLGIVAAAAVIFTLARFAFWIGYRINPLYRAFGFASTAYLNFALFGIAAWRTWT